MAEETKHDVMLKKIQLWLAVLIGVVTLIVGVYNVRNTVFAQKGQGEISVAVRSDNGQPVGQARVELLNAENVLVASAETNGRGQYIKKEIEAGRYNVKVDRAGYEPQMMTVSIQPKRSTDLNVILKATAGNSPVRSAVEEVGASWIKKLDPSAQQPGQKNK